MAEGQGLQPAEHTRKAPRVQRRHGETEATGKAPRVERRSQSSHPASFPLFWRDWLSSAEVRAMSRDERGGFMDVLCFTQGTKTVGIYTEEQCRVWANYSWKEWQAVREKFLAVHTVRRDGMWIQKRARRERLAQKIRYARARNAGKKGAQKRWSGSEMGRGAIAREYPSPDPENPVVKQQATPSIERLRLVAAPATGDISVAGALTGKLLARLAVSNPVGSR